MQSRDTLWSAASLARPTGVATPAFYLYRDIERA
jgi:hypothetical protein